MNGSTLLQLRTQAQQRSDLVNSGFVSSTPDQNGSIEWNNYINQAYRELYSLLVDLHEDYYLKSTTINVVMGVEDYNLPSDFLKLKGCERLVSPTDNQPLSMFPFQWEERNRLRYNQVYIQPFASNIYRYRLMGITNGVSQLKLIPTPSNNTDIIRVWYIPDITLLVNDNDQVVTDVLFDEFIILRAAMKALKKQEAPADTIAAIQNEFNEIKAMVIKTASKRRVDAPRRIAIAQDDYDGLIGGSVGIYGVGSGNPENN